MELKRCAVLTLAAFASLAAADVKVTQEYYRGWHGSYRLDNGTVQVVVVPHLGAVMHYGPSGRPNLLWENDVLSGLHPKGESRNFGGDWLRTTLPWEAELGSDFTAKVIRDGVLLSSAPAPVSKLQIERQITLASFGTEVRFRNRLRNDGDRRSLALIQSTALHAPIEVSARFVSSARLPAGWIGFTGTRLTEPFQRVERSRLILIRDPKNHHSFGVRAPDGEVTALWRDTVLKTFSPIPKGAEYPSGDAAQRISSNPDPYPYIQVDHASPLFRLDRGEILYQTVTWSLSTPRTW